MLTNQRRHVPNLMLFTQIFLYITFTTNRYVKHRILHVMWDADAISRVKNAN